MPDPLPVRMTFQLRNVTHAGAYKCFREARDYLESREGELGELTAVRVQEWLLDKEVALVPWQKQRLGLPKE